VTKISLTGAGGFLGWHTRCAAHSRGIPFTALSLGSAFDAQLAKDAINGTDRLIHIAGINRGTPEEVRAGNVLFADQVANALGAADLPPGVVVYANSTQSGNDTDYGDAKARASDILRAAAEKAGADFVDIQLPNLFGEHGRPNYNSVVANFASRLANGESPVIDQDREMSLLHAQNAAEVLLGSINVDTAHDRGIRETVGGLVKKLTGISEVYARGEIPDVSTTFDRDLFNTYRSFTFPTHSPISLTRHADARGSFFEIVRSRGGSGQSSFSTTAPGVTRGDHYHLRKIERFTVLSGEAVISLRKLFTSEVVEFKVTGSSPQAIDMPTMWAHNIVNTGQSELYTSFWSNEIFDPSHPDTIAETV
jgi:UDP-2-acetamido-2,6-beta-L-arabino-hexul-4-ose reductase